MTEDTATSELLFEVLTPLGFRVRVTRTYWELIITVKHPAMKGREADVQETLKNPSEIRLSKSDPERAFVLQARTYWTRGLCSGKTA